MHVLVLIAALSIAVLGTMAGLTVIALGVIGDYADLLVMITFGVSLLVLTLSLGLILGWHTWRSIRGYRSTPFKPRMIWLLGLLFVLAVVAGQMILALDLLPVVTFPPLHAAAAILPPLIILALVGRSLEGITSWREVTQATASGAFAATALAFVLEAIVVSSFLAVALVGVALRPGGLELLQTVSTYLQDPRWLQELSVSPAMFLSPVTVAAVLVLIGAIIPIIEEGVKTVGAGAMLSYRRPILSQAFFWGLSSGAGFALVEGLLNTASGLEAWALVIVLRVGATLLHCFTGALMGLAWYMILAGRRWGYALGLYAASVTIHSLWNALSVGMALLSLQSLEAALADGTEALVGLSVVGILTLLVILTLAMTLGLMGLTWQVRKRSAVAEPHDTQSRLILEEEAKV